MQSVFQVLEIRSDARSDVFGPILLELVLLPASMLVGSMVLMTNDGQR